METDCKWYYEITLVDNSRIKGSAASFGLAQHDMVQILLDMKRDDYLGHIMWGCNRWRNYGLIKN